MKLCPITRRRDESTTEYKSVVCYCVCFRSGLGGMIESRTTVRRSLYHAAQYIIYGGGKEREKYWCRYTFILYCPSDSPDSWWTGIDDGDAPGWPTTSHDDDGGAYDGTTWDAPGGHDPDHDHDDRAADHCWVIDDGCACIDVPGWCHARAGETSALVRRWNKRN